MLPEFPAFVFQNFFKNQPEVVTQSVEDYDDVLHPFTDGRDVQRAGKPIGTLFIIRKEFPAISFQEIDVRSIDKNIVDIFITQCRYTAGKGGEWPW